VKIGWLADDIHTVIGGAELCVQMLLAEHPKRIEIVQCPPGDIVNGLDLYIIHNCTQYRIGEVVRAVREKPFVKVVYEQWYHGDPALRSWLLANANLLLFLSKPHLDTFPHPYDAPTALIPTIVDLQPFREAWQWGNDDRLPQGCEGSRRVGGGERYAGGLLRRWAAQVPSAHLRGAGT
jgi:hypothetical protein